MSTSDAEENLRLEVCLLSSYLSRKSGFSNSHCLDGHLSIFAHLSTLLAISNDPGHQMSNAVSGRVIGDAVEVFIATDASELESPQQKARDSPIINGPQSRFGKGDDEYLVTLTPSKVDGRKLLKRWIRQTVDHDGGAIKSSFTFSEHLQDLCNIIVALDYANSSDLHNFQCLIHQRAYRKLGSRISEFSTHWGRLPFDILSDHVDPKLPPKTFTFNSQRPEFHQYIQPYITPESGNPQHPEYTYRVDGNNASVWLVVFKDLWIRLEKLLLVAQPGNLSGLMIRDSVPNTQEVTSIVVLMHVFQALMPILCHLLSAEDVAQTLAVAEVRQHISRSLVRKSRVDTDQDAHLELAFTDNDFDRLPRGAGKHLVRAMNCILAFQISCRKIFHQVGRFQGGRIEWRFSQVRVRDQLSSIGELTADNVSALFQRWQASFNDPLDVEQVQDLIHVASKAQVHAEAALMHYIATVKDISAWSIGTNKKCCRSCWSLHLAYNRSSSFHFTLPGHDDQTLPWLPPPGLPDGFLRRLRDKLLEACRDSAPTPPTSKGYSDVDDDGDVVYPDFSQLNGALAPT